MKNQFSTPFWLIISSIIGLVTLFCSSTNLHNLTKSQPSAIVLLTEDTTFGDIKISASDSNIIDTIFYTSNFGNKFKANHKEFNPELLSKINDKGFLNQNPKVFRWIIFLSVALSLFMASLPFLCFLVYQSFQKSKNCLGGLEYFVLLIGILGVVISLVYISTPQLKLISGVELMDYFNLNFSNPKKATSIIVYPLFFVSLIPIIGIMLCNYRAYCSFVNKTEENPPSAVDKVNEYNEINTKINIYAFYLGLLVSCAVISTGLQRDMIINQIGEHLYPKEILYAYGIAFSVILALFFIPSSVYLRFVGREYKGKVDENKDWWKIGQETIDNLKLALSISLPLISSIVQPIISNN